MLEGLILKAGIPAKWFQKNAGGITTYHARPAGAAAYQFVSVLLAALNRKKWLRECFVS